MTRILDPKFKYVPSASTNIADTFRRAGWKPMTEAERKRAQERLHQAKEAAPQVLRFRRRGA